MQYNPGDGSGIVDEINKLCDSTLTSYPLTDMTRRVNAAYEQVVSWILNADGTWNFDDSNNTTLPEGTTTLVAGQGDYSFPDTFLEIKWVKVLNLDGKNWTELIPIDQSQTDFPLENLRVVNGFPQWYAKIGTTVRLYPNPLAGALTFTNGLAVGFDRTASLFTTSDTTKYPGFASPFHIILAYMAALPYCESYKQSRVAIYQAKIQQFEQDIISFYGHRERDKRKVMYPNQVRHR